MLQSYLLGYVLRYWAPNVSQSFWYLVLVLL